MSKISKLIQSNIRKDVKQMVSFFVIIVLATVMLYSGLMVFFGYLNIFDEKVKELHTPDVLAVVESQDIEKMNHCLERVEGIMEYGHTDMIHALIINKIDGEDNVGDILFQRYSDFGVQDQPKMAELSEKEYDNAIYLPLVCKYYWDSKLDEEFRCKIGDKEYTFMIAGFYERMLTGGNGVYRYSMFVNDESYEQISENEASHNNTAYFIKIAKNEDDEKVSVRIAKELGKEEIGTFNITRSKGEFARTYLSNIIAAIFIVFSLIIAGITMLVINIKISNSIEQNITNIGVLKAIGYTSRQIRLAYVIQFLLTTTIAVILGIGISYIVLPLIEGMIRPEAIVVWEYGLDMRCIIIAGGIMILSSLLVAMMSTKKVRVLHPIIALRQGLNNHNFRKNYLPFETSKGQLNVLLAWKSILQSLRHNILLMLMMVAIGFAMVFALVFGYNVLIDKTSFLPLLGGNYENADVIVADETIMEELHAMQEVENVYKYNTEMYAMADDYQIYLESTDDFDDFSYTAIYEGRMPEHDNEIAISGLVAEKLGADVGDEIEVTSGAYTEKFLVVGLNQTISASGWACFITEEARMNRLHIQRNNTRLCVALNQWDCEDTEQFLNKVERQYGDEILGVTNVIDLYSNDNSMIDLMVILIVAISVLILLLIVLIIHLIIEMLVIRRQQEFGIEKAIGFTSGQIRRQLAMSTMSVSVIGNCIGVILGCTCANTLIGMMFRSLGIMKANFLIPEMLGVAAVVGLAVFVYITTYVVSRSVKRISAYRLISE